eukprot:13275577-Alexandrium_andersonii.AAC.1
MGSGDACLLVHWSVRPINRWSRTSGDTRPRRAEISAGPGPSTAALPWRVATGHANGTELQFWAGIGSQRGAGSGQPPAVAELRAGMFGPFATAAAFLRMR